MIYSLIDIILCRGLSILFILSKTETLALLIVSIIYYFFHIYSYLDYVLLYTDFSHNLHFYLQFLKVKFHNVEILIY